MRQISGELGIGMIVLAAAIILFGAELLRPSRPIITTPYTVQPIRRYGIDVADPGLFLRYSDVEFESDRVYILPRNTKLYLPTAGSTA